MANLRTAMDTAFWDLSLSTPQTLHGTAKALPGEPFPLEGARASKLLRFQQMSLLRSRLPLPVLPSLSPPHGSLSSQSILHCHAFSDWWLGLVGQFHPGKLISSIKGEFSAGKDRKSPAFTDVAKHILDKSLYSVAVCSSITLPSSSSLFLSSEVHGERKALHSRLLFYHKLPSHDVTVEAAWPELFVDGSGRYWRVPESISLDLASIISDSGLRYRYGIHTNRGQPQPVFPITADAPPALMPGLCAKAAVSYEKSKDFWREKVSEDDLIVKRKGQFIFRAYDTRLQEPHASVSSIVGGTCGAWLGGFDNGKYVSRRRSPLFADLFGSVGCTLQLGKFSRDLLDLTRVDARLDIGSALSLVKGLANYKYGSSLDSPLSSPRLSVILQQQVLGPVVFRVDTRIALNSAWKGGQQTEDLMYSLSYSLRSLGSGKVVAWYSPKRKEGMVELRVFEF